MRVEEIVGRRVRDRRTELQMTQQDFGQKLAPYLGKPWSRSTVSVAENGGRAFTAAEMVAMSDALGTTAGRLLTAPAGVSSIEFPGGKEIPASALGAALVPLTGRERSFDLSEDTLVALMKDLLLIGKTTNQGLEHLRRLNEDLWQAAETLGVIKPAKDAEELADDR